jgi:hypothetical protein
MSTVTPIRPGVLSLDLPFEAATQICAHVAATLRQPEEVVDDWDFWPPIESQLDAVVELFRRHDNMHASAGGASRVPRLLAWVCQVYNRRLKELALHHPRG